jgi:3-deoxy-D-manno-octulosonate 8-phosphate phosphatase (KDO 8-P phosphatase)
VFRTAVQQTDWTVLAGQSSVKLRRGSRACSELAQIRGPGHHVDVNRDLQAVAAQWSSQLTSIKLVVLDVDGVLTDGTLTWVAGEWTRSFHVHDGFGIKLLMRLGIDVAVISADNNRAMAERVKMLGIPHAYMGSEDKRGAWKDVLKKTGRVDSEALYIADELFDLPLLKRAGFSATVPSATARVREAVHYITERTGGRGAVREIVDLLCIAQQLTVEIPDF